MGYYDSAAKPEARGPCVCSRACWADGLHRFDVCAPEDELSMADFEDIPAENDDYRDPVGDQAAFPGYRGRWPAGFAPAGITGFVVIVQQKDE